MEAQVNFRSATLDDRVALEALIALSARELSKQDYTATQIDGALRGAWGVDSQLILDGTYFVGEVGGEMVACGGWSYRATDFGSDQHAGREPRRLEPGSESARIRAFFVHPAWSRRGLGSRLLKLCEDAAWQAGFSRAELTATLPGERLYAHHGYVATESIEHPLPGGGTIRFVRMCKASPA